MDAWLSTIFLLLPFLCLTSCLDQLLREFLFLGSRNCFFYKKLKNVNCEYNRLNGWNSTLQAAWYIRHVRIIWFLWTKPTIWLLILTFTQNIVRACSSVFYPYEGYRSVTPLDAARVNRTIFHNHSVHWYYITLIRVGITVRHGKQNPRRGLWL